MDINAKIKELIDKDKWTIIFVSGDDKTPPIAYSVGLTELFDHPEVVFSGLPPKTASAIINIVGERVREGNRFNSGEFYDKLADGFSLKFQKIESKSVRDSFSIASQRYKLDGFEMLQVIWPDSNGIIHSNSTPAQMLFSPQPELN